MSAKGATHDEDEDTDDRRGLYRDQHPAARASRFSSPSRPRREDDALGDVRSWGVRTAACCIVQGVAWAAMGAAATLVYHDVIPAPDPPEYAAGSEARWDDFATLLSNLYFREHSTFPPLPDDGLVSPRVMYYLAGSTLALNALWLVASGVMFRQMRLGGRGSVRGSALAWSAATVAVTVLDAVLAAAMARDVAVLAGWNEAPAFPGDATALLLCPVLVLVVALRAGVLLVANVVCMVVLLSRMAAPKSAKPASGLASGPSGPSGPSSGSPSVTKREGPIDAFLYRNGDRPGRSLGVQNPVFVPDEAPRTPQPAISAAASAAVLRPWASFAPQQQRVARDGEWHAEQHAARAALRPALRALRDGPDDDVSHLSWMEEVDKHVDVRAHSAARPSVPAHHRRGFVEPRGQHGGADADAAPGLVGLAGLAAGLHRSARHAGHPGHAMLPRVRINPNAPKFPVIPAPDYSPPTHGRQSRGRQEHGQGQLVERF